MKPGFHTQSGSTYHAFIQLPPCQKSGMIKNSSNNNKEEEQNYRVTFAEK